VSLKLISLTLVVAIGLAQSQPQSATKPEGGLKKFDVASVRLAQSPHEVKRVGGPGTSDPIHLEYIYVTLTMLFSKAYSLDFDQIHGPGWLETQRYDVRANVPVGSTPADLAEMFRNLLVERFHFSGHIEKRSTEGFDLTVARGGPKLTASVGRPAPPPVVSGNCSLSNGCLGEGPLKLDQDGFPILQPGIHFFAVGTPQRVTRSTFRGYSMDDLAKQLRVAFAEFHGGGMSMGHVFNQTGLGGLYDFRLDFHGQFGPGGGFLPDEPDSINAPSLFEALQLQLGLRLDSKRHPLDVLVVDSVDRNPEAN
jgi:uncharacterized protein (TIGR03435 family)